MFDLVIKPGDFSQAHDRINTDGDAGGVSASRSIYYGKVKLTFLKGTEPANGVTFNGSYSSYYSDGSSATFTISRTTLSETNNVATISLYSYRKNMDGFVTINAKASGGTSTTIVTIPFRYTSSTSSGVLQMLILRNRIYRLWMVILNCHPYINRFSLTRHCALMKIIIH